MATKRRIIIIDNPEEENIIQLTENDFLDKLQNNIQATLQNFIIDDELLFKYRTIIGVGNMLELNISSELFNNLINCEFLLPENVADMNTTSYMNFTDKQVKEYSEYLNWNKYILVLINKQEFDSNILYDVSKDIVDDRYWEILSTISLPIDFLKEYKEKIKWDIFFSTNIINDTIIKEFGDIFEESEDGEPFLKSYMVDKKSKLQTQIESSNSGIDITSDEIDDIINNNIKDNK